MKDEEREEYIEEFKETLEKRILTVIIATFMLAYAGYLVLKICLFSSQVNHINDSEFTYLSVVGTQMMNQRKTQLNLALNFLDGSRALLDEDWGLSSANDNCNSSLFLCNVSVASSFSQFEAVQPLLAANAQSLDGIVASIFFAGGLNFQFYDLSAMGLQSFSISTNLIAELPQFFTASGTNISILSEDYNKYIMASLSVDSEDYQLLCEWVKLNNTNVQLCVLIVTPQLGDIRGTSNNYLFSTSFLSNGQSKTTVDFIQRVLTSAIGKWTIKNTPSRVQRCIDDFPSLYKSYVQANNGLILRCKYQNSRLDLLGPYYTFRYYSWQIQSSVAFSIPSSLYAPRMKTFSLFVSSNSSYYDFIGQMTSDYLCDIRYSSYWMVGILSVLAVVLLEKMKLMDSTVLPDLSFLWQLCELLKSKEEKEFRKLKENYNPGNLGLLVGYFQQFLWTYRLLRRTHRPPLKKLLLQGLNLFPQNDYAPILHYIYHQLIELELRSLSQMQRIRQLPRRREQGSRCEEQATAGGLAVAIPLGSAAAAEGCRLSRRRNANLQLLNPDDDELMRNISVSFRGNRGVRFSNDIQTIEIDKGPTIRQAKSAEAVPSCETIKNDLSEQEDSLHKSDHKDSLRSLGEDQSYTSLADAARLRRREGSQKNRSLESIHGDLNGFKLDEQPQDEQDSSEQDLEEEELCGLSGETLLAEMRSCHQRAIGYLSEAIALRRKEAGRKKEEELVECANEIYSLTVRKYQQLHALLLFQNEHQLAQSNRSSHADFADFHALDHSYRDVLKHQLLQQGQLVKLQVLHVLGLPASFKQLEILAKSNQRAVRVGARQLLAEAAQQMQPHLDAVVVKNVYLNLKEERSNGEAKRAGLRVLGENLERYFAHFGEEVGELRMARQYYNSSQRKFYFLTSMTTHKPFTPLLLKFHELLAPFDLISLHNLEQQDAWDPTQPDPDVPRPKRKPIVERLRQGVDAQEFLQLFGNEEGLRESAERGSSKTISRRLLYEKEFHELLGNVEGEEGGFSRYIVLLLGEEQGAFGGETEDSSSNAQHRPFQQRIHQQITQTVAKGYLRIIMAGPQLDAYPSRYGRLKRYVKLSPELLEIDLADRDQTASLRALEKYLTA